MNKLQGLSKRPAQATQVRQISRRQTGGKLGKGQKRSGQQVAAPRPGAEQKKKTPFVFGNSELPPITNPEIQEVPGLGIFIKVQGKNIPLDENFLKRNRIEFSEEQLGQFGEALGLKAPAPQGLAPAAPVAPQGLQQLPPATTTIPPEQPPRLNVGGSLPQVAGVRVPTEDALMPQGLQTGGIIGQANQDISNIQANTGALDRTAGKLENFNPLGGAGGAQALGAQNNLLGGAPVDVQGITDVAQSEANQQFDDFASGLNEQAGALGLASSSSRVAALGREKGRLQENVANKGILAGVDERQQQAQRQAQGLGLFQGFGGQRLSGQSAAGGLHGQSAQLGLSALTQKAGLRSGLGQSLVPPTVNTNARPAPAPTGQQPNPTAAPVNPAPLRVGGRGIFGVQDATGKGSRNNILRGPRGIETGGDLAKLQTGGRIPNRGGTLKREDMGDFLAKLTFGTAFNRPPAESAGPVTPNFGGVTPFGVAPPGNNFAANRAAEDADRRARNQAIFEQKLQEKDRGQRINEQLFAERERRRQSVVPIFNPTPATGPITNPSDPRAVAAGFFSLANAAAASGNLNQGGTFSERAIAGRATGGKVPGSPVGGDTVPGEVGTPDGKPDVMLQGQEGIVPLDVMQELETFQGDPNQAVQIVNTIRDIMGQAPGPRGPEENGEAPGGGTPVGRQVGGSFNRSALFGGSQGAASLPPAQNDIAQNFQGPNPGGSTSPSFGIEGDPNAPLKSSGQVFVNGVDQSSELASSQLQAAQLKRRAAFFDSLIATSPQAAAARLSQRRDEALGQAQLFEEAVQAEFNRQSAEEISAGRDEAIINQGRGAAEVRGGQAQGGVNSKQIAALQKLYFQLDPEELARIGNPTVEQFIEQSINQQSGISGSGRATIPQANAARQQQARGVQQIQSRNTPTAQAPNPQGPLFTGQSQKETSDVFAQSVKDEIKAVPGAAADVAGENVQQVLDILDHVVGGVEAEPGAFDSFNQRLSDGNVQPEDIVAARQLVDFFKNQAGRPDLAEAYEQQLRALGV
jgi:hypothetical protein